MNEVWCLRQLRLFFVLTFSILVNCTGIDYLEYKWTRHILTDSLLPDQVIFECQPPRGHRSTSIRRAQQTNKKSRDETKLRFSTNLLQSRINNLLHDTYIFIPIGGTEQFCTITVMRSGHRPLGVSSCVLTLDISKPLDNFSLRREKNNWPEGIIFKCRGES